MKWIVFKLATETLAIILSLSYSLPFHTTQIGKVYTNHILTDVVGMFLVL